MPSLALGTGAGAASGLETLLHRLLMEKELKQRDTAMAETTRHNQAEEGLTASNIAMQGGARADTLAATRANQTALTTDRNDRLIQNRVNLRPIGAPVPAEEMGQDLGGGVPMGSFQFGGTTLSPISPDNPGGRKNAELPMASWKGSQAQITAKQNADTATTNAGKEGADQVRKYTIPGHSGTVEAFVDPRTHAMVMRDGSPLPQNAQPYEAPPNMTVIQSPDGPMQVPTKGGAAKPILDSEGKRVEPQTTAATRAMTEGAKKLQGLPDRVELLADQLGDDQFGIVASRLRQLALKVGSPEEFEAGLGTATAGLDRVAARFATTLGLLASGVGRVHGGARGGGSIQMIQYMRDLLGDVGTRDVLHGRMDAARDILGLYANGELPPMDAPSPGGGGAGAGGGLPTVGGTFNGGKVLRVTPLP